MLLTHILQPSCVKVPLASQDKQSAINELVDALDDVGQLKDKEEVKRVVLAREETRSTGIGSGIAIPHGKCVQVKDLVMALGIAHEPIDFDSVDGRPVRIIILVVSPQDQTGGHIQALASISRVMLDEQFREALEKSTSAEEAYRLLQAKEKE
jgi:fructose-specific phosphotransferase system IIA component